jgi:stearoyl-CoA desaturase (delta-9 desaturase)
MIFKPKCKSGAADVSDLRGNAVIQWQHNNYLWLVLVTAYLTPAVICGLGWRDWWGGLIYAGFVRSVLVHHVRVPVFLFSPTANQPTVDILR